MNKEIAAEECPEEKWNIDLEWLEKHNRSLMVLADSYLCAKCRKRASQKKQFTPDDLINMVASCCGKEANFVSAQQPILESIFRTLLATGNKAVEVGELSRELGDRRGEAYRASAEVISRLLKNDRYYGFRQAVETGK